MEKKLGDTYQQPLTFNRQQKIKNIPTNSENLPSSFYFCAFNSEVECVCEVLYMYMLWFTIGSKGS